MSIQELVIEIEAIEHQMELALSVQEYDYLESALQDRIRRLKEFFIKST